MQNELLQNAEQYTKQNKRSRIWRKFVQVMACIVVFCTTYALILPAITMEQSTICGLEEHTHSETCYTRVIALSGKESVCSYETLGVHVHTADCGESCGYADFVVHGHSDICYDGEELICSLRVVSAHTHTEEDCYQTAATEETVHTHTEDCYTMERGGQTCQLEESEGHAHSDACYLTGTEPICGLEEKEGHTHGAGCTETVLICELTVEPHVHDQTACYQTSLICTQAEVAASSYEEEVSETVLVCESTEEGHVHDDTLCYQTVMTTRTVQVPGHSHGEGCYASELICTVTEQPHSHNDGCYQTNSLCDLTEEAGHTHGTDCYERTLNCGTEETEGHQHTDECFTMVETLSCGMEESDVIASEEATTETTEPELELVCQIPEVKLHTHTDACFEGGVLVCGELQILSHSHEETCFTTVEETVDPEELTCTLVESEGHTHSESCLNEAGEMVCGLEEAVGHKHGTICYGTWELSCEKEEHTHSEECYPKRETEEEWVASFASAQLTGVWRKDVLAIAETQLGYEESTTDFVIWEDGTVHGYTRYGGWYGSPCGDWCGMFVSFCLHYAGVEGMPLNYGVRPWIEDLTELGLYHIAAEYDPQPGDLIFYDWEGDGKSDHVGLVAELIPATDTEPAKIKAIEGNSNNRVQYVTYELASAQILGYAELPSQLTEEEQARVDEVIALIDAMPSADEIDAKIAEFEEAEDYNGEEEWLTAVYQQVAEAYYYYDQLSDLEKKFVTNADKLMELEYIWSAVILYDPITSAAPATTWYTSTKDFVELNLYDYGSGINSNWNANKSYPGFQWNGGAYAKSDYKYYVASADDGIPNYVTDRNYIDSIDFGNSVITDLQYAGSNYVKSTTATSVGKLYNNSGASSTGKINWLWYNGSNYGTTTNRPVGVSTGYQSIKNTLVGGYPALMDGTSLSYLFTSNGAVTKKNTASIDGLFQQNSVTGEYSYNSRTNHAQYSNNFFQLYDAIITPNFITYPFGNFLPLNSISNSNQATQVGAFNYSGGMYDYVERIIEDLNNDTEGLGTAYTATQSQLATMLEEYRENWTLYPRTINGVSNEWTNLSAANAIRDYFWGDSDGAGDNPSDNTGFISDSHLNRMYNIDWDVPTNFFFGMEMKMNFMQPKGGMTGNDTNQDGESDYPMVFYFTGDDDVWVYIDGVLFLDLSGIHRHVGGEIDFVNGKVHYYALDTATGDVSSTPYVTYTFEEILDAAGADTSGLNANGTFKDYTTHKFNFYYMERGSGSSVCRLNFNFPLLKQNSISVSKEVTSNVEIKGDPDYRFQVLKAESDGTKTDELFIVAGTEYTIYDETNKVVGTGTTDENGVFTLKAGQRAEFAGINENSGKYYVRELLDENVFSQYDEVTVSGESTTTAEGVIIGSDTFTGVDSPVKDASSGTTAFRFTNDVNETLLGALEITKELTNVDDSTAEADKEFTMYVTLDGAALPVGTKYTVGGEEKTVATAGQIILKAGETARIDKILAGTVYQVSETENSAKGYTVTYTVNDEELTSGIPEGTIQVKTETTDHVAVSVHNTQIGTHVDINGIKKLANPDGTSHSYTFALTQVADVSGTTMTDPVTDEATVEIADGEEDFHFTLYYLESVLGEEETEKVFYYQISETTGADEWLDADESKYVVEVTVSRTDAGMSAAVTGVYQDGAKITVADNKVPFTNTLLGSLSLTKTVSGAAQTGIAFNFTLTADGLNGIYGDVTFTDGQATVTLKAEETVTLTGIPAGTVIGISETAPGYQVSYRVNDGDAVYGNETDVIVQAGDTVNVTVNNHSNYELPQTGGTGIHLYTIGGAALMILSLGFLMYMRYSRRRKGANASF